MAKTTAWRRIVLAARCRVETVAMAIVALALRLRYVWVTPPFVRCHDVDGHLEYIRYLLDHHALPKAAEGFSFYHPPLYFIISAIEWAGLSAERFSEDAILKALQLQSIAFELGFAAFSIATARLFFDDEADDALQDGVRRRRLMALFSALILFWPSTLLHSARIGNDDLTYLFFSAELYFASRFWLSGGDRAFFLAALSAALGVVTKTNGLMMFGVLGVLYVGRVVLREHERRPSILLERAWPMLVLFVSSTTTALGRAMLDTLAGARDNVLVGNVDQLGDDLVVGNGAKNYLWFDVPLAVTEPFTSALDDRMGRQLFWNYLMKTSLFGEWQFTEPWAKVLALLLSVLFLCVCAHVAVVTWMRPRSEWIRELPMSLTVVFLLASLLFLRMKIPRSCSGDFRYVLPILAPFCFWYTRGIAAYEARGWPTAAKIAAALGWIFAGVSVVFIGQID